MNWAFPVSITKEGDDFVISVRGLPEVVTSGDTYEEAVELAADAIEVVIQGRIEDELDLPAPAKPLRGEVVIPLSPHTAAKASVYLLWRRAGISKVELAARMGRKETEARRILNPKFGTKIDQLQEAAKALGGSLVVGLA